MSEKNSYQREHAERDRKIVALKKVGKTQGEICKLLGISSVNIVTGAISRARRRNELPPARNEPKASSNTMLGAQLTAMRTRRDSAWWTKNLPQNTSQCRWPSGDLLAGDLHFCKQHREHAETVPLALDYLPYCIEHKKKVRQKENRKTDVAIGKRNARPYRLQYVCA